MHAARLTILRMVSLASVLLMLPGCAQIFGEREVESSGITPAASSEGSLAYVVEFEGVSDPAITQSLKDASQAAQTVDRPAPSELGLARRAETDLERLNDALRGLGHYGGSVTYRIDQPVSTATADPAKPETPKARLVFEVKPGPRYAFGARRIEVVGDAGGFEPHTPDKIGLDKDAPAVAQAVLDAEAKLLQRALDSGHALAKIGRRDALVDHERRQMDVVIRIQPGPVYKLGAVDFRGADDVDKRYLTRLVPIRADSRFNPGGIEEGRNALVESGLFSSVKAEVATEPDGEGNLPLAYELVPRKHRSIGGGAGYQTDEGFNANVFWEHRNFLGAGERLRADLAGSLLRQTGSLRFKKPEVGGRRQSLLAEAVAKHEDLDAYESTSILASTGFEKQFTKTLSGSLGIAYRFADIDDRDGGQRFALVSVPGRMDWNFSDDLFDPTTGGRLQIDAAPYFDTLDFERRYLKARLTHSRYIPLMNEPRLILAARGAIGTILGVERDEVPADERFYAGGGGSIRGIPLHLAGPTDRKNKALGGRSFAEFATELRLNITPTIGIVTFVDVGAAYPDSVPRITHDLRIGAGAGLRYTTPIGPIRLDLAVPVDKKDRTDDPLQFYVSIGQAF